MSNKQYLCAALGKKKYESLPKSFREKIEQLDKLPPTPRPVTLAQIKDALK